MVRNTHVFGWDEEPSDERPSEFVPSTGYSVLSGYAPMGDLAHPTRRRESRVGLRGVLLACVLLLCASGFVLVEFVKLLKS